METDRMLADVADATARREDGVARSLAVAVVQLRVKARRYDAAARAPVGVDHLGRVRRGRSESRSRRRKRRTTKIRRNPVNPRRVAVTAEVVAALRQLAEAARETKTARVLAAVVAVVLRQLAEAARETRTARVLAAVVAAALRQLAEAARETRAARVLAAVVAVVPTDREAAFDPGVRVVTAAALAHCAAEAPAGDAARRLTVEAANDAAAAGAPIVGEVGAEAAVLRG